MDFDFCKECDCNSKRPIVNKKYYLCQEKNYLRIHGKTEFEVAEEKERKKQSTIPTPSTKKKKNYYIKQTKKQSNYETTLKESYKEFDDRKQAEGEMYCVGCGQTSALSHSHLIRVSWLKSNGMTELCFDHNMYVFHCLSMGKKGCHEKWESGEIELMLELDSFWDHVNYIKTISPEHYNKIMSKYEEYKKNKS